MKRMKNKMNSKPKTYLLMFISLAICSLCTLTLFGCGENKSEAAVDETKSAAILVINTSTSDPQIYSKTVQEVLADFVESSPGYKVCLFEVDGFGYEIEGPSVEIPNDGGSGNVDPEVYAANVQNRVSTLSGMLEQAIPRSDGCDTFGCISKSASQIIGSGKKLLIIGSGIDPAGFANGELLMATSGNSSAIELLGDDATLPDLSGCDVTWVGCGDSVRGEQQPLNTSARANFISNWKLILKDSGCKSINMIPLNSLPEAAGSYPHVDPVEVPNEKIPDGRVISEGELRFLPDQAVFADQKQAKEVAQDIVEHLRRSSTKYILAGTIAGDTANEYGYQLSLKRAQALKDLVVQEGKDIDPNRIQTMGCSIYTSYHQPGLGIGPKASVNRTVILCPENATEIVSMLKAAEDKAKGYD